MPKQRDSTITVPAIDQRTITVTVAGLSGLLFNRMSAKARRTLLVGGRRKTAAEKLELKHDPAREFVDSMHVDADADPEAAIFMPASAFKGAVAASAVDTPGVTKAAVQRLVYLPAEFVPIRGIPLLRMDVVRSADMNRTPDIRTRAYMPAWSATFDIHFISPQLNADAVLALVRNAGAFIGVGDFRQEKGRGSFGRFEIAAAAPEWEGKAAQVRAIREPQCANRETVELMTEYDAEREKRG